MKRVLLLLIAVLMLLFASCNSAVPANFMEDEPEIEQITVLSTTPDTTETPAVIVTPTPTAAAAPMRVSLLTGEALSSALDESVSEDTTMLRPYAIVINNLQKALPQSGISQAGLYYEVLAEGDITRIIAVFDSLAFTTEKVGPVRSTREYFIDFALDNDAIFVHHGGSDGGYTAIKTLKINNIDGMKYDGSVFKRDPVRVKQSGMYEHSSYTAAERLKAQAEKLGFRMEHEETFKPMFTFFETPGYYKDKAENVTVPFSKNNKVQFTFDKETGKYLRFEYGKKQVDEETKEQLLVTNIIIQQTSISLIAGDTAGRRKVDLVSSGKGYLVTNGTCTEIEWKKASHSEPTVWTTDGKPLTLNPGKTWVCVINTGLSPVFDEE